MTSGIFLDPLYSSGLDLVAIGNGLITDMIARELDGEDVVARAQISDSLFRSLTEMWLAVYQDQYTLMGTPTVMSAKIIWDVAFYWGFVGLLYMNGRFTSVADDPGFVPYLEGLIALSNRVQRFFREWAAVESGTSSVPFVDLYSPLNFMVALHTAMMGPARTSPSSSMRTLGCCVSWQVSWSKPSSRRSRRCSATTTSCGKCRRGNGIRFCTSCARPTATSKRAIRSAATGSWPPHRSCSPVDHEH